MNILASCVETKALYYRVHYISDYRTATFVISFRTNNLKKKQIWGNLRPVYLANLTGITYVGIITDINSQ